MLNADILPSHASHPGWDADGCPARLVVTPRTQMPAPGFACRVTGGHCLPGDGCGALREEWALFQQAHPRA